MRKILGVACVPLGLLVVLAARPVGAQTPVNLNPRQNPKFSPYLNLVNRGNAAVNYYGIVRPQIQQNQQLQMLQFGLAQTTAEATAALTQPAAPAPGQLPDTGHAAGFMTYTKYFNTVAPRR